MNTIDIIFTLMFCKMLYLFFSLSRYLMSRDFSDLVVRFLTRVRGVAVTKLTNKKLPLLQCAHLSVELDSC
jgi:hypothetical protein